MFKSFVLKYFPTILLIARTRPYSGGPIKFPIQSQTNTIDLALCRDAYLAKILESNEDFYQFQLQQTRKPSRRTRSTVKNTPGRSLRKKDFLIVSSQKKKKKTITFTADLTLSPTKIDKKMIDRRKYLEKMQHFGFGQAVFGLINQLRILLNGIPGHYIKVPAELFTWSVNHLLDRLDLSNEIYLSILRQAFNENEIENLKLVVDIKELISNINLIYRNFVAGTDFEENVFVALNDANKEEFIEKSIFEPNKSMNMEKKNLYRLLCQRNSLNILGFKTERSVILNAGPLYEIEYIDPVVIRYNIGWHNSKKNQFIYARNLSNEKLREQIDHVKLSMGRDRHVINCNLNMYFETIEEYKDRCEELNEKYETDLQAVENLVTVTRNNLQNAMEHLNSLKAKVEMMRARVIEVKAEIQAEEQRKLENLSSSKTLKVHKKKKKQKGS